MSPSSWARRTSSRMSTNVSSRYGGSRGQSLAVSFDNGPAARFPRGGPSPAEPGPRGRDARPDRRRRLLGVHRGTRSHERARPAKSLGFCGRRRAGAWPAGVPAQLHFSLLDRGYDKEEARKLESEVLATGSSFELFEYRSGGHLFADPGLPDYDEASALLFWKNIEVFLDRF
jgi:hypothetical protein